jgi:hypothetical protein
MIIDIVKEENNCFLQKSKTFFLTLFKKKNDYQNIYNKTKFHNLVAKK